MCNLPAYDRIRLKNQISKLENEITDIDYAIIQKDDKGYKKLLRKLTTLQVNAFDTHLKDAVGKSIEYLLSIGESNFKPEHLSKVQEVFQIAFGEELPAVLEAGVFKLNKEIYKFGINEVGKSVDIKLSFDVPDEGAAAILGKQNLFWIQNYYSEQLKDEIDKILEPYFTADKTIKDVAKEFESNFDKVNKKGSDYFEGLAEHTTNRVRELGKITGYEKAGVTRYEIVAVIDDRTSDICLEMNGKIFEVSQGVEFRDKLLSLDSPEEIKTAAPWRSADEVKDLTAADLPPGMELPPYHWRCRTTTVVYFD